MKSRRDVLRGGLGIFAAGAFGPAAGAAQAMGMGAGMGRVRPDTGPDFDPSQAHYPSTGSPAGVSLNELKSSRPLAPRSFDLQPRIIDGFRFKSWFEGDDFHEDIPFHSQQNDFPDGQPPEPSEEVDVAVIGGGIAGLSAALELAEYNPVVFELHDRFGGNAQGGTINGAEFPLGSAYFITPDDGTRLNAYYKNLGLHDVVRIDDLPAPAEINGQINDDIWSGMGVPKEDIPAYEAYRKLVLRMADEYPDVPFPEQWMIDLDKISLREHIEQEMGMPVPAPLAAAIQAYCYASFVAGWEEVSATLGWNFLAAEEYGRWVLPGGNAWMAEQLWQKLRVLDRKDPAHAPHLRPNRRTVDARQQDDGRWLITWIEPDGSYRSLLAKEVVMACAKNIARHILYDLENEDPELYLQMRLPRRAYLVANVIVDQPIPLDFYDIFLLENPENYPMSEGEAQNFWRYTDVTNGSFTPGPNAHNLPRRPSVLTLYWPLPYESARFTLILGDPIERYALALTEKLRGTLNLVGLDESNVMEIRFARWGHAVPLSRVRFLADGLPAVFNAPYKDSMHFANQDNWGMPAIENAVFAAFDAADAIKARLG
ncbi:MAG: FAD-dependent oxidoreductase [Phycisphaerales bacterium]